MTALTRLAVLVGLILCGCASCIAQEVAKDSLLIGPGDEISIQVLEAPELAQRDVRVTDSGMVPLIIGGPVKVADLTPAQAATSIEKALKSGNYVLNPHVSITVDAYATAKVTVMGQVNRPGSYSIGTPRSVIDVLALAGGITDLADRSITIERHGSDQRIQYFLSNQSTVALNTNGLVYPGDIVLVPKVDVVYVLGDVPRPGGYPMSTNDGKLSLLQAVALAGSAEPSAKNNKIRLIRKQPDGTRVEMQVALEKIQRGQKPDFALRPDDIIYVPFSYLKNVGSNIGSIVSATGSAAIYRY